MNYQIDRILDLLQPKTTELPLIRLGDFKDGGYLVPDDFQGISACFSPGVSNVASFEMDLAKRGIRSFMADASVERPPLEIRGSSFIKKFLGPKTKDEFISLGDWIDQSDIDAKDELILQMDIEGAEYDVLRAASPETLKRFRIIVMEFHMIPKLMLYERAFNKAVPAFELLHEHFHLVHLHPNNAASPVDVDGMQTPRLLEATYIRKDRVTSCVPETSFPHPLDAPNIARKPDIQIPKEWFR